MVTKTKTNGHGGVRAGQGRKPINPALKKRHALKIMWNDAELALLTKLAEAAGYEDLATFVRETTLSARAE